MIFQHIHLATNGEKMKTVLDINDVVRMMKYVSRQIINWQDLLNEADRLIGDGDHGTSMARGFEAVLEVLDTEAFSTLDSVFLTIGNTILSAVGGSAGVIFCTLFRSGSKALIGKETLDSVCMAEFLEKAMEAIMKRGGAKPGDKTMLDALYPAVIRSAEMKQAPLGEFLKEMAVVSDQGVENTKLMKAAFGRAKTYKEGAVGFADPGAITTSLIFKYMEEFIASEVAT
jgi:dihydroxyacetone kinase-like protein